MKQALNKFYMHHDENTLWGAFRLVRFYFYQPLVESSDIARRFFDVPSDGCAMFGVADIALRLLYQV